MTYIDAPQAASTLGITRQGLGKLLRSGLIDGAIKAGKKGGWIIPVDSLQSDKVQHRRGKGRPKCSA